MKRGATTKIIAVSVIFSFLLFSSPYLLTAKSNMGNLLGFVFDEDGSTPLNGAVVTVLNVSTGLTYKSDETSSVGSFSIADLEKGIYIMGVTTDQGDFNANSMVGIHENKTSKVSISLAKYDETMSQAAQDVLEDQKREGEALVGKVESYNAETKIADVYILKGYLSVDDRIHVLGPKDISETDFRQNLKAIVLDGKKVKKVFSGQTIQIELKKLAVEGDLVYLVCKGGFPIFLLPLGAAVIFGGTALITGGDDEPTSKFKK